MHQFSTHRFTTAATTLMVALLLFTGLARADVPARLAASGAELGDAIAAERFREITSVLVSHEGELVYEQYWGDGGRDYMNDTRSATKSLTAMLLGAAIADGHIDSVDTPAFSWFAEERPYRFESPTKDAITLRDLLTMSSALDCDDNVWESPGNEEHMHPARRWVYFVLDLPTKEDYARDERGFGPFSYCTAGTFLLGQIIERAAGEVVDQYMQRRLFAPLDIPRANWHRSPSGEAQTGGGTELTSRDLLKLAELVRTDGAHDGDTVLPASWVREMLQPYVKPREQHDYGYQWWREDFRCGDGTVSGWYMAGNGGNKVAVFDDLDLSVVVTARLYGTRGMHQQSADIINDYVLPSMSACSYDAG